MYSVPGIVSRWCNSMCSMRTVVRIEVKITGGSGAGVGMWMSCIVLLV